MKIKPSPEVPKEYTAFKDLLRQVVKPVPKPVLAHVSSDKAYEAAEAPLPVSSA